MWANTTQYLSNHCEGECQDDSQPSQALFTYLLAVIWCLCVLLHALLPVRVSSDALQGVTTSHTGFHAKAAEISQVWKFTAPIDAN